VVKESAAQFPLHHCLVHSSSRK